MGNVVKFPGRKRVLPLDTEKIRQVMPKASTVKGVFAMLFHLIRLPLFFILFWLRLPIMFVCNLVSVPMLFAWLFTLYAFPDKSVMVWGFGIVSFLAFIISWGYDFLLMAIAPQDMILTL